MTNTETLTSSLEGENDEGYYSVLDFTSGKQTENSQQQSHLESFYNNKREEIKKIKNKHLKDAKYFKEKLEELTKANLKYCHEIEILKNEREGIKKLIAQYRAAFKYIEEQMVKSNKNNLKYCQMIEALMNDKSASKKVIIELQAIVQEQGLKLQQMEGIMENKKHRTEKEYHATVEMKKNKITDIEKYKIKLHDLEIKYKEMLKVKKECEIVVKQRRERYAELHEDYERKMHELMQWKAICTLKQDDEAKVEERHQKIMRRLVEDMTKIQQSVS